MTDLEKLVEKRAEKYKADKVRTFALESFGAEAFTAGATDPLICKAIELRERAKVYEELFNGQRIFEDSPGTYLMTLGAQAEAELAQLMAGIEEKV